MIEIEKLLMNLPSGILPHITFYALIFIPVSYMVIEMRSPLLMFLLILLLCIHGETVQLLLPDKFGFTFEYIDIFYNIAGALIGFYLMLLYFNIDRKGMHWDHFEL